MEISAAIRKARSEVQMVRFGNQWQVNTWSAQRRAWWQGGPTDYHRARALYSEAVVRRALEALGYCEEDACGLAYSLPRGSIRSRIKYALDKFPA